MAERPPAMVITGASTGIGAACALHFAAQGWQVYAGVRREEDGERLVSQAQGNLVPVMLDVTSAAQIAAVAEQVRRERGEHGLQVLINNAGIAVAGPLEFIPLDAVRRQLEVNVVGLLAVTQAFLPLLRQGGGRIVNISSILGKVAFPTVGPYAASKFAIEALSDVLRRELARWHLPVVSILPGEVRTPIWEKSLKTAYSLLDALPPEGQALYGDLISRIEARARRNATGAMPVEKVVAAVARACTAKHPRPRYVVGGSARLAALLARCLPDQWLDKFIVRMTGRGVRERRE